MIMGDADGVSNTDVEQVKPRVIMQDASQGNCTGDVGQG